MRELHIIEKYILEGEHENQDFKFQITDASKIAISLCAFANTTGGRLLIGVKDNGRIAGTRSEEEFYMIQAAADMHTLPPVPFTAQEHEIEGKRVLEITVPSSPQKPHYHKAERPTVYVRKKDENIVASPVLFTYLKNHLSLSKPRPVVWTFTEVEKEVLAALYSQGPISLKALSRSSSMRRPQLIQWLALWKSWGLVEEVWTDGKYFYRSTEEIS